MVSLKSDFLLIGSFNLNDFSKRPKEVNLNRILQSEKYLIFVQQNSLFSFPIQLIIFKTKRMWLRKHMLFLVLQILKRKDQSVQSQQPVCI